VLDSSAHITGKARPIRRRPCPPHHIIDMKTAWATSGTLQYMRAGSRKALHRFELWKDKLGGAKCRRQLSSAPGMDIYDPRVAGRIRIHPFRQRHHHHGNSNGADLRRRPDTGPFAQAGDQRRPRIGFIPVRRLTHE